MAEAMSFSVKSAIFMWISAQIEGQSIICKNVLELHQKEGKLNKYKDGMSVSNDFVILERNFTC